MTSFLYKAKRLTDGKEVVGSLLHAPNSPFAYIATIDAMNHMRVDDLSDGETTHLKLVRIMLDTARRI